MNPAHFNVAKTNPTFKENNDRSKHSQGVSPFNSLPAFSSKKPNWEGL